MCNRRKITETITGPATDALERSLKRPRTESSTKTSVDATFYFPDLYNDLIATIDGSEEAFPTIAWDFGGDSETDNFSVASDDYRYVEPRILSLLAGTTRTLNSLQRSKSFRTNLAEMNENPNLFGRTMLDSKVELSRIIEEDDRPRNLNFFSSSRGFETTRSRPASLSSKVLQQECDDPSNVVGDYRQTFCE